MIAHFSLRLICGASLMWCLMPRREVSSGFFRIQMLLILGLSVLSALTLEKFGDAAEGAGLSASGSLSPLMSHRAGVVFCLLLAGAAFLGSVMWTLERRTAGGAIAAVIALVSLAALLSSSPRVGSLSDMGEQLRLLSDLSSAVLLGGAVTAMLLGHWYLTAPTMSIEPLRRMTWYFGGAGLFRLVVAGVGFAVFWGTIGDATLWSWLALRWAAGLFGPLAVFVMVWRILKHRNTQSATGVLYVGVILTFLGELTGSLLYRELSAPL